ncbi:alpha/beta fold hydrolase [Planctobacterium marinum]|uniref:alpha/beta fold hydrolase n=1 Tax=Planctobacterium marinum TaxID=1631968 RepID=UPI001E63C708|nr:alpha/beta hydrolase [Planctobacterium marinum]MCC2604299.1 alpha/beta hydrolase [Planctobacterium marinum]
MNNTEHNLIPTDIAKPVTLHFAHANGFPASSYKKLWQFFPDNFVIHAHEKFGHDKRFPVNDNWQNQVNELICYLQDNCQEAVYLVGHSFGGVISFLTSCQRPDLVKGLIMLDPPIMVGMMSHVFRVLKKTPLIDKLTPSGKSKIRKVSWDDKEQVLEYFKPKALFRNFDPECVQDYVSSAIRAEGKGAKLAYHAEVETAIFRNIPHNLNLFSNKLSVPAKLFTAQHTNACFPPMVRRLLKQQPAMEHQLIKGVGHMFPLEKPQMTAGLITQTLNGWESDAVQK